ncbi:MAG: DUF2141 domain-containing protein [Planctomycetes bacterium]|nr:DUF2141 domain-containing protein [Planctomycetota bacterium]MBM4058990.1 DUF2141 domain-containing protein [Planctomycetota bacterium]
MRTLLFSTALVLASFSHAHAATLEIVVSGLKRPEGRVRIAVWASPATFLKDPLRATEVAVPEGADSLRVRFEDLPPGKVAASVIHDLNGNQRLDTGFGGIPKEPYGFSRAARGRFGPPSFDDAAFEVAEPFTGTEIKLK